MQKRFIYLFSFILLAVPQIVSAYSSITVPVSDPVYRKLDKLAAHGLITTMIVGQKPFVRMEIARLIEESLKNYPEFENKYRGDPDLTTKESGKRLSAKIYVDRILRQLKFQYKRELIQRGVIPGKVPLVDGQWFGYIRGDYLYLDQDKETVRPNNGLGGVDAFLQPLVWKRNGRHYNKGNNWSFESHHWMRLSKYFSMEVLPRFQFQVARPNTLSENKVFLQRLNGHITWNKLDLEVGRDSIVWGPNPRGGLALTNNPRPLDFIKIGSVQPFQFPFFFKHLGHHQMTLVIANLGPEQDFKNPFLVAWNISSRSNKYFELGFTHMIKIGGEGAPSVSFGEGIIEFFDITNNESKDFGGVAYDLLGRIPPLRGMEVYATLHFSDFTSNMNTLWVYNTSYIGGLYIPRLTNSGNIDLRLEYRRLGARYSRSMLFTDGMTENKYFLGDSLGPDAFSIFSELFYDFNPTNLFSLSIQYSHRNNNQYQYQGTSVVKVADNGNQDRILYRLGWKRIVNQHLKIRAAMGVEQIFNANFASGKDRVNWLGEVGFTVYLDPFIDKQSTF